MLLLPTLITKALYEVTASSEVPTKRAKANGTQRYDEEHQQRSSKLTADRAVGKLIHDYVWNHCPSALEPIITNTKT